MTAPVIRIGSGKAYRLRSGGWMCTRPGEAFPTWRADEHEAGRLLRSWLPTRDFPATAPGFDRPSDIAPRVSGSRAPGTLLTPPGRDPGATSYSQSAASVGAADRANPSEVSA